MIKPIIGRIGGKWRLSKWIIEHIKRFEWSLYVEPFCGSAAVYFQLLNEGIPELIKNRGHHPRFVLNDLDSKIINLYRVCRDYPELLAYAVYFTPYSREEHKLAQRGEAVEDLIESCHKFLIRDKQSYSRNGERINQSGKYNCPFATTMDKNNSQELTFANTSDRILTASEHLGERFNELREGIKSIQDETLKQQSEQALEAILNQLQQNLETDVRVDFVRKFLVENKQSHSHEGGWSFDKFEMSLNDRSKNHKKENLYQFNDNCDRLLKASEHLGSKKDELELQKAIETDLRVDFARKFLVDSYQSFTGKIGASWAFRQGEKRTGVGSPIGFNKVSPSLITASPHLQEISELKKVYLENDDFEKVCRRWDTAHTLHYIDAPYYGKEDYYEKEFTTDCHSRLCQMAHEMEGQVIISYYPHPDIMAMYSENDWEFHYKETVASSKGITKNSKTKTRPKRTELLLVRKAKNTEKKLINLKGQTSLF